MLHDASQPVSVEVAASAEAWARQSKAAGRLDREIYPASETSSNGFRAKGSVARLLSSYPHEVHVKLPALGELGSGAVWRLVLTPKSEVLHSNEIAKRKGKTSCCELKASSWSSRDERPR